MEFAMNLEVETLLKDAADAGQKMGRRSGISGHTLIYPVPTLWGSFSMAWAPQNILHVERYNTILEFYSTLFSSMYSQQFFVKQIVPNAAPYLLFLGIILRSFFVTRRLGGLLIAIALGVMIVLPLMYVFDWITMRITIYGDKALEPEPVPVCPESCQTLPPAAFNKQTGEKFYSASALIQDMEKQSADIYTCKDRFGDPEPWADGYLGLSNLYDVQSFIPEDATDQEKLRWESYGLVTGSFQSGCQLEFIQSLSATDISANYGFCFDDSYIYSPSSLPYDLGDVVSGNTVCPISCRELPYPFGKSECVSLQIQWACSQLPAECKQKRTIPSSQISDLSQEYKDKIKKCDAQCKMTPPMKSNCYTGEDGKLSYYNSWTTADEGLLKTVEQCNLIDYKLFYKDSSKLTEDEKLAKSVSTMLCKQYNEGKGQFVFATNGAPASSSKSGAVTTCFFDCAILEEECLSLPVECRIRMENEDGEGILSTSKEDMTNDCNEKVVESCPASLIPEESCVYVVPNEKIWGQCADCLLIDDGFTFEPPIATDCQQLCSDTNWKKTKISPAQFAVKTKEGMVGRSEIKNAASFVIPLYVLPLLNILVTLMFIKTFSQILGGDIEIPGLQKVF
jgi:hypothetical protein